MSVESTIAFFSGNDVLLKFTVTDQDNPPAAKDLTGATDLRFAIATAQGKPATLEVTTTPTANGSVITPNVDPTTGKFEVTLAKADTEPLSEKHTWWEARVTDSAGKTATVGYGTATISKNTITA